MKTGKKVFAIVVALILVIVAAAGYYWFSTNSGNATPTTPAVETVPIHIETNELVLSGQVKTKETTTAYYDYDTYGKLWDNHATVGQHVNEGDIIVEAGKKDYKAPFSGYIAEINPQAAYDEAKKAYDNDTVVEKPMVLYTLVSDDYYIETELTEYDINRLPANKTIRYAIRALSPDTYYDASIRLLAALPKQAATGTEVKKTDISTYGLTLNMDSGKEVARVGNNVTIRITSQDAPVLQIPATAVFTEAEKTYVYVVSAFEGQHQLVKTEVTGTVEGDVFTVASGLNNGVEIVKNITPELADGIFVHIEIAATPVA